MFVNNSQNNVSTWESSEALTLANATKHCWLAQFNLASILVSFVSSLNNLV